jgi:hypothetical protein
MEHLPLIKKKINCLAASKVLLSLFPRIMPEDLGIMSCSSMARLRPF